ncbi:MAG: glycerol kinase [Anaerolineae bacterium UTCFX2]|jgi:glycerol kinase|nr:glycerol kinase GlpK [Anaerolineae bacterium]MCZ7553838.1 glycerol kinase GlpK [Anaerolineales bacterium]OQY89664.1 MAG: glycerol kinase [Anaerolineae bacterium UTCFX2]
MNAFVASIDQGTTSTRCMLFTHSGAVAGIAQKEHRQIYPQPGWVEHDPLEIWENTQQVIRDVLAASQVNPAAIVSIGVTNQRETTLIWDKRTGKPYYNAIVWQDTRTKEICDRLAAAGGQDRFRRITGLPIATYFSGPKALWILENIPGVRQAAEAGHALFGTIDTWLIWWLTGGSDGGAHVTDVSNASRTLLMNLETLEWDAEMTAALQLPRALLPRIVPSSDPDTWGHSVRSGPFGAEIPVCGDLGDQQAALVGQTCFSPGEAKNTYGTGCFMLLNTGMKIVPSKSGLLTTLGYKFGASPANYALEGSIAITGALVQWLRDNLGLIQHSSEVEELAKTVADNGGIYFVPAFSGLFAPYWRSDARGAIVGMTRYINKGHIARAALEATAFQTREVLDAMKADSGVELSALKVDGGMVNNDLLMQFQSDILNVPVLRPRVTETTALGAAYAAGLAVGYWSEPKDLRANWQIDKTWQPQMDQRERARLFREWKKAVQRTLDWVE